MVQEGHDQAIAEPLRQASQVSHVVLAFADASANSIFPALGLGTLGVQHSLEEGLNVLLDRLLWHVNHFGENSGKDVVEADLLFLATLLLHDARSKKIFDRLEERLLLGLLLLLLGKLVDEDHHTRLKLVLGDFDGIGPWLVLLSTLGLVVALTAFVAPLSFGVSAATIVATVGGVRHHRVAFLHIDFFAVASIVASVVTVVTATVAASTAATSVAVVVAILLLANRCLSLHFLDHLLLDLFLGLNSLLAFLELGPAELLVLDHVLDELLDTHAYSTLAVFFGLRCLPDAVKLG